MPLAEKKFFKNTQMSPLNCRIEMGMGDWELLDKKNGNGI